MQEVLPGIYRWSWYSQEKGYDFNGYCLKGDGETVVIDPPPPTAEDEEWMSGARPITHILITNRDHVREAGRLRELFSCKVLMHELDAPLVDLKVDETFRDGDRLPGGFRAVHVPGNKSPGETAFWLDRFGGILFLGDALIGKPSGRLNLMPPDKYADLNKARQGIRALLQYNYDAVLVGDGESVSTGGRRAVEQFLEGAG